MNIVGGWKDSFRFFLNYRCNRSFVLQLKMRLLGLEKSHFLEIKCKDLGFRIVMLVKLFNLSGI
jgi:hypothetical protein